MRVSSAVCGARSGVNEICRGDGGGGGGGGGGRSTEGLPSKPSFLENELGRRDRSEPEVIAPEVTTRP